MRDMQGGAHAGAAAAATEAPVRVCRAQPTPASPLSAPAPPPFHPPSLQATLKKKEAELELVAPYSRSYGRTLVSSVVESESQGLALVGRTIRIGGWVKTGREAGAGAFAFLEVNDGSCFQNIQVRRRHARRGAGAGPGCGPARRLAAGCVPQEGTGCCPQRRTVKLWVAGQALGCRL